MNTHCELFLIKTIYAINLYICFSACYRGVLFSELTLVPLKSAMSQSDALDLVKALMSM